MTAGGTYSTISPQDESGQPDPEEIAEAASASEEPGDDGDGSAEPADLGLVADELPEPRSAVNANTAPHVITSDEYGETGYRCITIFYYGDDNVPGEDDRNMPVRDVMTVVGTQQLGTYFGKDPDNPFVVLIRCPRLSTDFEICLKEGSYAHEVLGPNLISTKKAAPLIIRRPERKADDD